MAGKGDSPRPLSDRNQFESNFDSAFRKKSKRRKFFWGEETHPSQTKLLDSVVGYIRSDLENNSLGEITDTDGNTYNIKVSVELLKVD